MSEKRRRKKEARLSSPEKKNKIKKFFKKLKSVASRLGHDAPFYPLLPFKHLMRKKLEANQIQHDGTLRGIATTFARKHKSFSHFEEQTFDDALTNNFVGLNIGEAGGVLVKGISGAGISAATGNYAGAVGDIIKAVTDYFKKLKEKKNKGEKLTKEEEKLLVGADKVTEDIANAAIAESKRTVSEKVSDFIFSWKGGLSVVGVVALGYFAFKKK